MPTVLHYLAAKACEHARVLDWVEKELSRISRYKSNHPCLDQQLTDRIASSRLRLRQLESIVLMKRTSLAARGISVLHQLKFDVFLLVESYLPAVKNEGELESRFATAVLKAAHRCGLPDIQEFAISMGGGHAVLPAIPSTPLLFVPPQHAMTLVDLVGIYHELGHVAFRTQQRIGDELTKAVSAHFSALEAAAGFLTPAERSNRRAEIRKAEDYWDLLRLNELFSDIFATFVVGPAYCYSTVDMAIGHSDEPYEIDLLDEHPPMAARVDVCMMALDATLRASELAMKSDQLWKESTATKVIGADFRLYCEQDLLRKLTDESAKVLISLGFPRYTQNLPTPVTPFDAVSALEALLNESALTFLRDPASYAPWEESFVRAIFG